MKLIINRLSIFVIILLCNVSCSTSVNLRGTEIYCPEFNYKNMLLEMNIEEVKDAINHYLANPNPAYEDKNYTVINFKNDYTFYSSKITPYDLQNCQFTEYNR